MKQKNTPAVIVTEYHLRGFSPLFIINFVFIKSGHQVPTNLNHIAIVLNKIAFNNLSVEVILYFFSLRKYNK